jgi:deuterolysin
LKSADAYVTIPAGKSVTVKHDIGFNFDFVGAGVGKYTFEPLSHFQSDSSDAFVTAAQSNSVEIDVTQVDAKVTTATTTPTCNDSGRRDILAATLSEARALAGGAASDVRNHPNSGAFNDYFGNSNRDTIWWNFDRIAGDLSVNGDRK